jgi:hypothetical protein
MVIVAESIAAGEQAVADISHLIRATIGDIADNKESTR